MVRFWMPEPHEVWQSDPRTTTTFGARVLRLYFFCNSASYQVRPQNGATPVMHCAIMNVGRLVSWSPGSSVGSTSTYDTRMQTVTTKVRRNQGVGTGC